MSSADGLLVIAVLIWGGNYGVVKSTLDSMSALAFVFARFSLAAAIMGMGLVFVWSRLDIERRHLPALFVASACAALYQVAFVVGLSMTTSTNSALLYASTPVVVLIISAVAGPTTVYWRQVVGMLVAFVGVSLVITSGGGGVSINVDYIIGDLITMVSVVLWSCYIYANSLLLRHYPSTPLTALELVIAWFILIPLCLPVVMSQDWGEVSMAAWGGLMYAVVGSTIICYSLCNYGIRNIGPVRTLVYQYLTPVVAVGSGVMLWREQVFLVQVGGGLLVLIGVVLVRLEVLGRSRFVADE